MLYRPGQLSPHPLPTFCDGLLGIGGNIGVGLEDSLWIGPGRLAQSNAEQVRQMRQVAEGLGLGLATPAEARAMLALKGGDAVGF